MGSPVSVGTRAVREGPERVRGWIGVQQSPGKPLWFREEGQGSACVLQLPDRTILAAEEARNFDRRVVITATVVRDLKRGVCTLIKQVVSVVPDDAAYQPGATEIVQ